MEVACGSAGTQAGRCTSLDIRPGVQEQAGLFSLFLKRWGWEGWNRGEKGVSFQKFAKHLLLVFSLEGVDDFQRLDHTEARVWSCYSFCAWVISPHMSSHTGTTKIFTVPPFSFSKWVTVSTKKGHVQFNPVEKSCSYLGDTDPGLRSFSFESASLTERSYKCWIANLHFSCKERGLVAHCTAYTKFNKTEKMSWTPQPQNTPLPANIL